MPLEERSAAAIPCKHAKTDEHRQIRGKAAECRAQHEQEEAAGIEELAPDHVGKAPEDRQEGRHGQQVCDRDPAYRAQPGMELELELRKQKLRDTGIELAHEGADTDGSDHEPAVRAQPGNCMRRGRLAPVPDDIPQRGDGDRTDSDRGHACRARNYRQLLGMQRTLCHTAYLSLTRSLRRGGARPAQQRSKVERSEAHSAGVAAICELICCSRESRVSPKCKKAAITAPTTGAII